MSVLESQTFFEVQIELLAVNPHSPADIPGFEPDSTQGIAISFYNYYNSILCFVNTRFTQTNITTSGLEFYSVYYKVNLIK